MVLHFIVKGKSALWSHLLAFQRECEEIEEVAPTYSQDTNSLSPLAGNDGKAPSSILASDWVGGVLRFTVISPPNHLATNGIPTKKSTRHHVIIL